MRNYTNPLPGFATSNQTNPDDVMLMRTGGCYPLSNESMTIVVAATCATLTSRNIFVYTLLQYVFTHLTFRKISHFSIR